MMPILVEVDLKIDGKNAFEYQTSSVPREGEYLNISHDEFNGECKVIKVTHKIFQRKNKDVITYIIVEATTVTKI
jgi:hypothetical protein